MIQKCQYFGSTVHVTDKDFLQYLYNFLPLITAFKNYPLIHSWLVSLTQ